MIGHGSKTTAIAKRFPSSTFSWRRPPNAKETTSTAAATKASVALSPIPTHAATANAKQTVTAAKMATSKL